MKKAFLFLATIALYAIGFAQANKHRCGTYELMLQKEQQHPGYLNAVNTVFNNARQLALQNKAARANDDTIYRIQVVFHVLYTKPEENIPDSVIYSQIDVLNRDYRRRNADTTQTRDFFKPVAGDAGIEFYLATTDPDGNPTNGITRAVGNPAVAFLGFNPQTDDIKSLATGGADPWPTDRYLNIWVGNVFFGVVLGYAFPPDNAPNWSPGDGTDSAHQGVVLHYAAVGDNFSAPIDPTVAGGRSAVHEIGHYLGLRHIWGDATDCIADDGISDTPFAADASQQTCDTTINSCTDSPVDFPDMIENYMDYSDDRCLNMFTVEQIGIMRSMLQTSRAGIATPVVNTGLHSPVNNIEVVQVYPNPSKGKFDISVKVNAGSYNIEVYNAVGEKLFAETSISANDNHRVIDLSAHANGIYFVKLNCSGQVCVKKVQVLK